MPVTATAVVTTILLAMHGVALTFDQIRLGLADALVVSGQPGSARDGQRARAGRGGAGAGDAGRAVAGRPGHLRRGRARAGLADRTEQQLAATFYRNSLIHFLLDTALCELAVLRAGEAARSGRGVLGGDRPAA